MTDTPKGVSITLELRDEKAEAQLRALIGRMSRKSGFFKAVGEHMVNSTRDNFRAETEPDGVPWTPLSLARIRERERKGLTPIAILRAEGFLAGSIAYQASEDEVRWGVRAPYAAIHQFGGEIMIPGRTQTVYRHFDPKLNKSTGRFASKTSDQKRAEEISYGPRRVTIPARPYLGTSAVDEIAILEAAEDWLDIEAEE